MEPFGLVGAVVLLGVVAVLPLALGGRWWWWAGAGSSLTVAFLLDTGLAAAVLVLPWGAAAGATLALALRRAGPARSWRMDDVVLALASVYALVAAGAMLTSRLGTSLFGVAEPIVALTAVHYTYAGSAALVLAGAARSRSADAASAGAASAGPAEHRRTRAGTSAVVLTATAPPVVALGFLLGHPLPQVGGAVLMTLGVWLTASLQLALSARGDVRGAPRVLLAVSGLAVWVPMILAVAWATGQHVNVPVLSIPDMARTHGLVNALGFTLCGLAAHRLAPRPPSDGPPNQEAHLYRPAVVPS